MPSFWVTTPPVPSRNPSGGEWPHILYKRVPVYFSGQEPNHQKACGWRLSIRVSYLCSYPGSLLDDVLLIEKDRDGDACENSDKRRGETGDNAFAHADGKEQVEGEDDDLDDDGNGHAQRGDNAAPVRPRPPSTFSRALRGDAEVADVAGDEGHVCLDHADDRKIGNGLHGPERS